MRVMVCETPDSLRSASELFNSYRAHYGQSDGEDHRAYGWLSKMVRADRLQIFLASVDGQAVGFATSHVTPASLAMKTFWQLRDLYVRPEGRRHGVGRALVLAVKAAAERAGATRLSLVTEPDNSGALVLYESLGFTRVDELISLTLGLQ